MRLTDIAKAWLGEVIEEGDTVVDATLGNGHDALFLAQHIGKDGHLFAFDVQEQAITSSRELLQDQLCQQHLFLTGHEHMQENIPAAYHGSIKAIMFNLGWLPNSDKSIITQAETTITALEQSLHILAGHGRLTVMVYPGHEGGDTEAAKVITWLEQQRQIPTTLEIHQVPNKPHAPILLQVCKQTMLRL